MHDISQVEQFLHFLDPTESVFTFCFLDQHSKEPLKGHGTVTLSLEELPNYLSSLDKPTAHVTLNRTNGKGRRAAHIESARVLCVDLDRIVPVEEIRSLRHEFQPSCIVESSPGRYHLYWRISPTVSLDQWQKYQLALACYFSGDYNLAQITKTIRVPGVERVCKDGTSFLPTIKYLDLEGAELDDANILSVFPWIEEYHKKADEKRREERKTLMKMVREGNGHLKEGAAVFTQTGRNSALFTAVYSTVKANREMDEPRAMQYAIEFNENFTPPLDTMEVEKTAHSAYLRAESVREKQKEKLDKVLSKLPPTVPAEFSYDYEAPDLKENRFTHMAALERVLQRYGHMMVRAGSTLYAFDESQGNVWRPQKHSRELISGFATDISYDMLHDPLFVETLCLDADGEFNANKKQAAEFRFASHQFVAGTINRIIETDRIVRKDTSTFDNEPTLLYCSNGVLDMRTLKLSQARAEDYLLHQTSVKWDPTAECPWWENFVAELFAENDDPGAMVTFMQQLFGYTLSGSIDEQKVFVHAGGGCNGKSKVLDTLGMLGGQYSARIAASTLSKSKKAMQQEFNRLGAKIAGKRVAILDDLDTNTQWNEGTIKQLTSAKIPARNLYDEERDIANRAKIHIGCNQVPEVEAESEGIIRRICLINYNRMFTQSAAKEAEIREMTSREAPGILRWAVEGFRSIQNRIVYPEETLIAATEYRHEQFKVEGVVERIFSKGPDPTWEPMNVLLEDVKKSLQDEQAVDRMPSPEQLGRMLSQTHGFKCERRYHAESGKKARFYLLKRCYQSTGLLSKLD
jgi:P4 family phage/plasmid primase-like protien